MVHKTIFFMSMFVVVWDATFYFLSLCLVLYFVYKQLEFKHHLSWEIFEKSRAHPLTHMSNFFYEGNPISYNYIRFIQYSNKSILCSHNCLPFFTVIFQSLLCLFFHSVSIWVDPLSFIDHLLSLIYIHLTFHLPSLYI